MTISSLKTWAHALIVNIIYLENILSPSGTSSNLSSHLSLKVIDSVFKKWDKNGTLIFTWKNRVINSIPELFGFVHTVPITNLSPNWFLSGFKTFVEYIIHSLEMSTGTFSYASSLRYTPRLIPHMNSLWNTKGLLKGLALNRDTSKYTTKNTAAGFDINFFVRKPAGDYWEKFGHQFVNFGHTNLYAHKER